MKTATAVRAPERVFSPDALMAARLSRGKTRRQVSIAIDKTEKTIASYELGRFSPQADDLAAIATYLGVDVMDFFPVVES